jgi:hypothetical protein
VTEAAGAERAALSVKDEGMNAIPGGMTRAGIAPAHLLLFKWSLVWQASGCQTVSVGFISSSRKSHGLLYRYLQ